MKTTLPAVESASVQYGWEADKGTYEMRGRCFNCRTEAVLVYRRGQRTHSLVCPNCGCKELHPSGAAE